MCAHSERDFSHSTHSEVETRKENDGIDRNNAFKIL